MPANNRPVLANIAIVLLVALLFHVLFSRLGLPGILGMIGAGVLLGPSGLDRIHPGVLEFLAEAKTAALIVILIRAGLGISKRTLNRIGGPAVRMGFIPCLIEGLILMLASHLLLGLSWNEAGLLAFILAAVSPAVVVPGMLDLKERGFGRTKEVPTLVLAGASVDDVVSITVFGVFVGLATGGAVAWWQLALGVPGGILLGALVGVVAGLLLTRLFKRFEMRDTRKVIVFMIVAIVFHDLCEQPAVKAVIPIASLLGIMAIGFVILESDSELAHRLASKFAKIWVLAEVLLFVYIGSELKLDAIQPGLLVSGLLLLAIGLSARSVGVWASLTGSGLTRGEMLFCMIAYLPKATVQAAIGAVPLSLVLEGAMPQVSIETATTILALAVLSIVVTAPLGAIGIALAGPRLLSSQHDGHESTS